MSSVTLPSSFTGFDPDALRAGVDIVHDPQLLRLIEDQNWLFSHMRQTVAGLSFNASETNSGGLNDGIWQGTGSSESTTADGSTYVLRGHLHYQSRAIADNNDLLTLWSYAYADTAAGGVRVTIKTTGGSTVETLTASHTTTGSASLVKVTASSGALDSDTTYVCEVSLMAGSSGYLKLWGLALFEDEMTQTELRAI